MEKTVSILVPCHNEQDNLHELYARLTAVMSSLDYGYSIILIDDGSTDRSIELMTNLTRQDERVCVLEFSRNFGHQAALCAGLDFADGDAVIMMDGDLQHPPEMIPVLISKWCEGYEIVSTVRNDPSQTPVYKKLTASLFYKIINILAKINIPPNSADFRLLDRKVVLQFRRLNEKTKFFRGLVNWVGYRQFIIPYDAEPRQAGTSSYTLMKMLRLALDGITSFSSFPLQISTLIGIVVSSLSFVYAGYAIYMKLFTNLAFSGWASVLVSVLFLGGIQLLSIGIIGEYINRIYTETKARPTYIIRSVHAINPDPALKE